MKILPVGDELLHADGHTDGYGEANSRFSQFCKLKNITGNQQKNKKNLTHLYNNLMSYLMSG
jgi:hypothetical protein